MSIRPYRPQDLDACRDLWAELTQVHRDLYGDPTIGGDDPGLYFDHHLALAGPEHLWVAEWVPTGVSADTSAPARSVPKRVKAPVGAHDAGRVVGLVGLLVEGEQGQVEPIVVAPGERGHGIGRLLLERAIAEARALGLRFLGVRPVIRNEAAIPWFHRSGFRKLGQVDLFMDLRPEEGRTWRPGPTLAGCAFED